MASMQCYETVEKTCTQVSCPPMTNQGLAYNGMGLTHASHGSNHLADQNKTHGHGHSHGHAHEHALIHSSNGHGHGSSISHCTSQNCAPNNGTTCHGRTKKKGLLQKIKDSLDGHSSDSSDSESDDECRGKTRTMKRC